LWFIVVGVVAAAGIGAVAIPVTVTVAVAVAVAVGIAVTIAVTAPWGKIVYHQRQVAHLVVLIDIVNQV